MMVAEKLPDVTQQLKDALDIWAEWFMAENDSNKLGYGRPVGFDCRSGYSWDEFERQVEKNMAVNMQAIIEGLPATQQAAVFYFNISSAIKPVRINIEDDYASALVAIEVALRRRGLI